MKQLAPAVVYDADDCGGAGAHCDCDDDDGGDGVVADARTHNGVVASLRVGDVIVVVVVVAAAPAVVVVVATAFADVEDG